MIVIGKPNPGMLPAYMGRPLAFLLALDVVIAVAYVFGGWTWLALPDVPLSVFGGIIGVIAGFRNASAYARWWEARIIWGGVVNNSRTLAREVLTMIAAPSTDFRQQIKVNEVQRRLILLQIGYVHSLRHQLRGTAPWAELAGLIPEQETEFLKSQSNVPLAIQQSMASLVAESYRQGWIDQMRWVALDKTLGSLMDCQGASERIKNTPMPRLYDIFIKLFINIFCLLLPLGMVASLGLWTPLGSTLVGFMFLALDKVGRDLEGPFENTPHDIPLTAIARTIEINLKQLIGEQKLPEPVAEIDGILW